MTKIKKIHKIILFFFLIFMVGVYYFSTHIESTIDTKQESIEQPVTEKDSMPEPEAIQIN